MCLSPDILKHWCKFPGLNAVTRSQGIVCHMTRGEDRRQTEMHNCITKQDPVGPSQNGASLPAQRPITHGGNLGLIADSSLSLHILATQ